MQVDDLQPRVGMRASGWPFLPGSRDAAGGDGFVVGNLELFAAFGLFLGQELVELLLVGKPVFVPADVDAVAGQQAVGRD